ncbi:hypothetical protein Pint_27257 [Pistacia integerrima]|uniref:Uncharacterized protein n=1 Tax=Pistacia integerrima TaxID=434235 RepID=A0ACC0YTM7_9ROSI|nr:hypothetical protein Pint_27257 [Pistacia integerrima]
MKAEQVVMLEEAPGGQKISHQNGKATSSRSSISSTKTSSQSENDLCHHSESFRIPEMGVPISDSSEKKLSWLRSQIIGGDVEFDSPFGKRRLTYADHTASGRCLHYIEDHIIDNVLPFYGNTHTGDSFVGDRTTKMLHEASHYIKRCLGGGRDDAIIFCGSGTTAAIKRLQEVMGIAVTPIMRERLIKCLSTEERWVVLVGPYEHHSNILSWRQSLAEVIEIGLDDSGLINIEELRLQLELYKDSGRPILGSFSACSNVTGIYSDTRSISRLVHQHGGFACFDFAASGPYVEIDMRSGEIDGYDAVFLSPHKFLGGPGSPGILLMSKALYRLGSSPPSTCGGGTVEYVNGFNEADTLYLDEIEERENGGTPQIIQTIRAALAFWVKEYIGYEVIEKQEDIYIERALERLLPNRNIEVLGNITNKRQAILSFLIHSTTNSSLGNVKMERGKPLNGAFVTTLFNDLFGIQARGGCACAAPYVKPGWTRISFPYYMLNEEFEFILAALEFLAIYGQRFLSLYHFNIRTGSWCFKKSLKNFISRGANQNINLKPLQDNSIQEIISLDKGYNNNKADAQHLGMIFKYTSYLENARHVASLLPKFPPERSLPEEIDPSILHFRI